MKVFIAVLALAALVSADYVVKTPENLQQYRQECIAELKVPDSQVIKFKKWEFPNDSITQCYLKCVFLKFGLFDIQTGFNVDNIRQQLKGVNVAATGATDRDDVLQTKIQSCVDKNEQGSNACEWAYRGATCFFKQNLQLVQQNVKPQA